MSIKSILIVMFLDIFGSWFVVVNHCQSIVLVFLSRPLGQCLGIKSLCAWSTFELCLLWDVYTVVVFMGYFVPPGSLIH